MCLLLTSCALTPYRPLGFHGGYTDQELERGQFRIYVRGQWGSEYSVIKSYFERRAIELCQRYGDPAYKLVSMDERPCDLCLTVKPEVVGTIQCQNMQPSSSLVEMKGLNKEQRESLAFLDERLKALANQLMAGFMGSSDIRVAVLPIENASGAASGTLGNYLTERLTNNLYAKSVVKVVERAQLKKVVDELALTQGGNFDEGSAKKIGRFLGVDAVVTGTYAELGNQTIEVNSRMVRVETGEVLGAGTIQIPSSAVQQLLR